jgi:TPR repeat protein
VRHEITNAIRSWSQGETKSELSLTSQLAVLENGCLKWNKEEERNFESIPSEEWEQLAKEVEQCIATRSATVSQGLHDKYMQYVMNKPEGARKHGQIGGGRSLYIQALSLLHGIGAPVDKESAVLFLHQAAEEGVPEAISLLGYCYELADGVAENPKRAFQCYEAAYQLGDPHAAVRLGRCLWEGLPGVLPKDRNKAPLLIEEGIAELRKRVARNQDGLPGVSRALMLLHTQMNLV